MREHSSSRDIVERKKWDLMKDSWRPHIKRAGNRTRPYADSMDELTWWVNEATSLFPRKITMTGPSTRRPAHSSKIQRASNRQIRLLEREAMIAKDLLTDVFIVTHSIRQISTLAPHWGCGANQTHSVVTASKRFKWLAHGAATGNQREAPGVTRGPSTTAHRTIPEVAK